MYWRQVHPLIRKVIGGMFVASRNPAGKSRSGKTTTRKTTSGQKRRSTSQRKKKAANSFLPREILILLSFALSALLFLSNLHMCGSVGTALYQVMRGLFGALAYVFPVSYTHLDVYKRQSQI